MRILVHICCAPCFTYPHKKLKEKGDEITGFFYNPNIHPYIEYKKRLETLLGYAKTSGAEVIYKHEYDLEAFLRGALESANRCEFCYTYRLGEAAKAALDGGFDAFTTTLLVSPYQKHELLKSIGKKIEDKKGVPFYYEDLRPGYQESRRISRNLGLYMQKYCGCIFSEKERYRKKVP